MVYRGTSDFPIWPSCPGGPPKWALFGVPGPFWAPGGPRRGPGRARGRVRGPGGGPGGARGRVRGRVRGPGRGPGARLGPPEGPSGVRRARRGLSGARGGARTGSRDRPRARRVPPDGLLELKTVGFCWFSIKIIVFWTFGHLKCAFSKATVCKIQSREMLFRLLVNVYSCSQSLALGPVRRSDNAGRLECTCRFV